MKPTQAIADFVQSKLRSCKNIYRWQILTINVFKLASHFLMNIWIIRWSILVSKVESAAYLRRCGRAVMDDDGWRQTSSRARHLRLLRLSLRLRRQPCPRLRRPRRWALVGESTARGVFSLRSGAELSPTGKKQERRGVATVGCGGVIAGQCRLDMFSWILYCKSQVIFVLHHNSHISAVNIMNFWTYIVIYSLKMIIPPSFFRAHMYFYYDIWVYTLSLIEHTCKYFYTVCASESTLYPYTEPKNNLCPSNTKVIRT